MNRSCAPIAFVLALSVTLIITGCSARGVSPQEAPARAATKSGSCGDEATSGTFVQANQGPPKVADTLPGFESYTFSALTAASNAVFAGGQAADSANAIGEAPATVVRIDPATGKALARAKITGENMTGMPTLQSDGPGDLVDRIDSIAYSDTEVFVVWQQVKARQSQNYTLIALDRCSLKTLAVHPLDKAYGSADPFFSLAYDKSRDQLWFEQGGDGAFSFAARTLGPIATVPIPPSGTIAGFTQGSIAADDKGNVLVAGGASPVIQVNPDTQTATPVPGYDNTIGRIQYTSGHWFYSDQYQLSELQIGGAVKPALAKPISANFAQVSYQGKTPYALTGPNELTNTTTGAKTKLAENTFVLASTGQLLWGFNFDGTIVVIH